MAKSDGVYFDYQLMNETFTATGDMNAESLITGRFEPKPFTMLDTKGRPLTFMEIFVLEAGDKFYAYLMPLAKIQGRKDSEPVLFDVDRDAVPFTMHAVTDKNELDSVKEKISKIADHQEYKINNFTEWLSDTENGEDLQLMVEKNVSVGFKRLAAIKRDDDVYVVIQPADHLEMFPKHAVYVYKCNDKVFPPEFELAEDEISHDILNEYYGTLEKKNTAVHVPSNGIIAYDDFFETTAFVPADGKNIYEILLVKNEEDLRRPFILNDSAGRKMTFKTEAVYSDELKLYAVLNPVSEIKGCEKDTEILFFVDDEVNPPVMRVVTDDALYDRILDAISEMFSKDEKIELVYPAAWMVLCFNFDQLLVFCKGRDGSYCKFSPIYTDMDDPDTMYAVLCALSSSAGFKKGVEYVFSLKKHSETDYGDPELVTDVGIIKNVMRDRRWHAREKARPSATGNDSEGPVFTCPECYTEYRGNVCPTCGTERSNSDSASFPECTFLNRYSEAYCQGYVAWELKTFDYKYPDEYKRCGGESDADTACVLDFKPAEGGYIVTGIGGCRAINLQIPSEHNGLPVVGIEKSAFAKSSVVRVRIPGSVKFVGASAFEECPELWLVRFDSAVAKIEERTFAGCPKLRGVNLKEGVLAIGAGAFSGCPIIDDVQIPKSLATIEEDAFDGCTSLHFIYYEGCAEEWKKLKTEDKGNDPFIRSNVIYYSKEKPTIPGRFWHYTDDKYASRVRWKMYRDPVTDYSTYLSNEYLPTFGLKYRETDGGYVVTGRGRCEEKNIVIPSTYKGKKVVGVEGGAFLGDDVLRNLIVSEGVEEIGDGAFQDCTNLKGTVIMNGVETMEDRAFSGCGELTYLVLPTSLSDIGKHAFDDCDCLTIFFKGDQNQWNDVRISSQNEGWLFTTDYVFFYSEVKPKPVKGHWHYSEKFKPTKWTGAQKGPNTPGEQGNRGGEIKYPFDPAVNLPSEEVLIGVVDDEDLPHNLEYQRFGKSCAVTGLGFCTDIKRDLVIPSMYNGLRVVQIGPGVFRGRTEIYSLTLSENVVGIDAEAFRGCTNLSVLNIPDTVEKIGNFAFSSCGVEKLYLPEGMWYHFGKSAFENCKKLRSVVFGERNFDIPSCAFRGCTALEYIVFPLYFSRVEARAFESCESLRAVFYPSTEKEWKSRNKYNWLDKDGNECLEAATLYFYSEERPQKTGNFWHYDDEDNPVIWEV